jgi:hypothetical protein
VIEGAAAVSAVFPMSCFLCRPYVMCLFHFSSFVRFSLVHFSSFVCFLFSVLA